MLWGGPFTGKKKKKTFIVSNKEEVESLKKRVEFYEAILNNLPNDLVVFNEHHQYIFINPTGVKNKELREFLIGKDDYDYCEYRNAPHQIAEERRKLFLQAVQLKKDIYWEDKKKNGDTTEVVSRRMRPIFDENGNLKYVLGFGLDISKLRETEIILNEKLEELKQVLKHAASAIIIYNQNGTILQWNQAATHLFGYTKNETNGKAVFDFLSDERLMAKLYSAIGNSEIHAPPFAVSKPIETKILAKNGTLKFIEAYVQQYEANGNIYYAAFVNDITEKKNAEEKLNQLNAGLAALVNERTKELENKNESLKHFTSMISHDLRAPLRSVIGFTQVLKKTIWGYCNTEQQSILENIISEAKKMDERIQGLLKYSRLSNMAVSREYIDVAEILNRAFIIYGKYYENKTAVLKKPESLITYSDEVLVTTICDNLISNALKYSSSSRQTIIEVTCTVTDNEQIFCVSDNGIGFNNNDSDDIFKVFHRLHTDLLYEGLGIGLAHVKKCVERIGGKIWVESELEVGSKFYFTIPNQ